MTLEVYSSLSCQPVSSYLKLDLILHSQRHVNFVESRVFGFNAAVHSLDGCYLRVYTRGI